MKTRLHPAYQAVKRACATPSLLACSGGLDSSALLVLAAEARDDGQLAPVVVYVDHQARAESASDGLVVESLARRFALPFQLVLTAGSGRRSEAAMRGERYAALGHLGHSIGIARVATAHTRNDQVETILMRLLSGSGALAASGMRAEQHMETTFGPIEIVRPLLNVARSELEELVAAFQIEPIVDQSNDDRSFRRNALRLDILPHLRASFPGFEDALVRSVRLAATDASYADEIAGELEERISAPADAGVSIDRRMLRGLHPALSSRVVRRAALQVIGDRDSRELTEERVLAVVAAASGRSGATIELPYGIVVNVEPERLLLIRAAGMETEQLDG